MKMIMKLVLVIIIVTRRGRRWSLVVVIIALKYLRELSIFSELINCLRPESFLLAPEEAYTFFGPYVDKMVLHGNRQVLSQLRRFASRINPAVSPPFGKVVGRRISRNLDLCAPILDEFVTLPPIAIFVEM